MIEPKEKTLVDYQGALEQLRKTHEFDRELNNFPLKQPEFPPPYDKESYCFFDDANPGWNDKSGVVDNLAVSVIDNPFDKQNIEYAEEVIDCYRDLVPYPEWSTRIGNYPVPDYLNALAVVVADWNYAKMEQSCGARLLYYWGVVTDLIDLRAYCVAFLEQNKNPFSYLDYLFNKRKITDIIPYIKVVAKNSGFDPREIKKALEE